VSDRLKDLQRQRNLALEQLAWLDREIAAAGGTVPARAPGTSPVATAPAPVAPSPAALSGESAVAVEAIMAKYQRETDSLPGKVKLGCFIYFALAFLIVGLGVLALYLYTSRK